MGLGATSGQHVTAAAEGPDAEEAVATILAILAQATQVGLTREHRPADPRERSRMRLAEADRSRGEPGSA